MKKNKTSTPSAIATITTSRKSKRAGWAPIWLLAFLFALPSCFEISCIKLVGCELLADDASNPLTGNQIGETDFDPAHGQGAARALEQVVRELVFE